VRGLIVAVFVSVAAATATAQPVTADPDATEAAQRFVEAIERRDDTEIRESLRAPIKLTKLRFDDPSCQRQFGGKRVAKNKSQIARLATCLPVLTGIANLRVAHRGDPSLFLESDDVTLVVGYRGRFDIVDLAARYDDDDTPTVSITTGLAPPPIIPATTFERLRIAGTRRIKPPAHVVDAIVKSGKPSVDMRIRYCVGTDGRVATVTIEKPSSVAPYDLEVTRAIRAWRFRPYLLSGKPTFACARDIQLFRAPTIRTP
jgi:TonB family protein